MSDNNTNPPQENHNTNNDFQAAADDSNTPAVQPAIDSTTPATSSEPAADSSAFTNVDLDAPTAAKTLGTDKFSTKLLSCPPIQLEWKNLNYKVKVHGKFPHCWTRATTKPILQDLNGYVAPGEVLAIMGPSYV